MSSLTVSNVVFEATSNNRIDLASNTFSFVAGGTATAVVNSIGLYANIAANGISAVSISSNNLNINSIPYAPYQSFRNFPVA